VDTSVARIIDANLNRAREALRVLEDYARFALDDAGACALAKSLRHDLGERARRLPAEILLDARDTPGDVGTHLTTGSERERPDARAVAVAAAKRLPEALRTLEEYAKTFDAASASGFEAMRYRSYDLEIRVLASGQRRARFKDVALYVIVTESLCRDDWLDTARQAIAGGAGCIQLREKQLEDGELLDRSRRLRMCCHEAGVLFLVNDRPDIAVLSEADGVHLGQTDMSVADARRIVGPARLIGFSTHTPEQVRQAVRQCPDYVAVGPMYASSTKPQDHVPGAELLRRAAAETELPVVPIGGITPANAGILVDAGARCVCVCASVIGADDVTGAARALLSKIRL
jgi:thiamine-phosphate pyrophosphorylase